MKFELDTKAKTVKFLEDATLGEINEAMNKVLGEDAGKYRVITNVTYYNPTFITQPVYVRPTRQWWESPFWHDYSTTGKFQVTCSTGNSSIGIAALQ